MPRMTTYVAKTIKRKRGLIVIFNDTPLRTQESPAVNICPPSSLKVDVARFLED